MAHPRTALFWRSSAAVTDVLGAPPEPPIVQQDCYLPEPCLFSPEQVTECPSPLELDEELSGQLEDMSRWETVDPAQYSSYADDPQELYLNKALGAPTGYILRDALVQVVAVLVVATAVGTAVGLALGSAITGKAPFALSAPAVATSGGLLIGLGTAGAVVAVRRITAVDPLTALGATR